MTFGELSEAVLKKVILYGEESERIDLVFDIYVTKSIKNAERIRRGASEGVNYHKMKDGHKIKSLKKLLDNESKNKLNRYSVDSWKEPSKSSLSRDKTLFLTNGEKCIVIKNCLSQECMELESSHKEADKRLILHMQHASNFFPAVVCVTDDTDVFILCLSLS